MPPNPITRFFTARLNGTIPLSRLFWRDMLITGSAVNIALMVCAVAYLANEGTVWMGTALFFAAMPYNIFLVVSVWRTAEFQTAWTRYAARLGGALWFLLSFAV